MVLNNGPGWFPGPALYTAIYHGLNRTPREVFLGQFSDPQYNGRVIGVPTEVIDYVSYALESYGLKLEVRDSGPVSPESQAVAHSS